MSVSLIAHVISEERNHRSGVKTDKSANVIQKHISQFKIKISCNLDWEYGGKKLLGSPCPEERSSPNRKWRKSLFVVHILQSHMATCKDFLLVTLSLKSLSPSPVHEVCTGTETGLQTRVSPPSALDVLPKSLPFVAHFPHGWPMITISQQGLCEENKVLVVLHRPSPAVQAGTPLSLKVF